MDIEDVLDELENVRKRDYAEIRSFASAPSKLMSTFMAVSILLGEKSTWRDIKLLLANPSDFVEKLRNLDKDNISPQRMEKVRRMIAEGNMNPDEVRHISSLGETVCRWVVAIEEYDRNKASK